MMRGALEPSEVARRLEAAHAGHLDIEQNDLRLGGRDELNRLEAVARLAHDLGPHIRGDVTEQLLQALARRRLVVDDENLQRSGVRGHDIFTR